MSRFTMALVAAATAAIAAIAVVALPAIGDDSGGGSVSAFAACLRSHGLEGAPSDPMALKPWLARKEATDPDAVGAALTACKGSLPDKPAVTKRGPGIEEMIACVRKHGLDAPTDPAAFKQWVADQESADPTRLHAALDDCKLAAGPKPGAGKPPADCGAPPADKPEATARRST